MAHGGTAVPPERALKVRPGAGGTHDARARRMRLHFEHRRRLLTMLPVVVLAAVVACKDPAATTSAAGYCDCVATSFVDLEIPASLRADLDAVDVSGPACTDPTGRVDLCDSLPGDSRSVIQVGDPRCAAVTISANEDGVCHITVKFRHHASFVTDVTFSTPPNPECGPVCARRPVGLDGGTLAVPDEPLLAPDASTDAATE